MITFPNRLFILLGGRKVSIVTGRNAYCTPREDKGPYTEVEVGSWEPIPELEEYADGPANPENGLQVYGYVPVEKLFKVLAR